MWCPRCNQGKVIKNIIKVTNEIVYVCQECDALWPEGTEIKQDNFKDFSTYVKPKGLKGLWSELQEITKAQ